MFFQIFYLINIYLTIEKFVRQVLGIDIHNVFMGEREHNNYSNKNEMIEILCTDFEKLSFLSFCQIPGKKTSTTNPVNDNGCSVQFLRQCIIPDFNNITPDSIIELFCHSPETCSSGLYIRHDSCGLSLSFQICCWQFSATRSLLFNSTTTSFSVNR